MKMRRQRKGYGMKELVYQDAYIAGHFEAYMSI